MTAAERLRTASFHRFVATVVPDACKLLEIGCGNGQLARALAADGHDVLAIDPEAPDGSIFRRVTLEEFDADEPFDVAVASVSLHHIDDPRAAVERIATLLRPRGLLVLEEFARERLQGLTARWYHAQRRALAVVDRKAAAVPDDFETWQRELDERLGDVHRFAALRAELDRRFAELHFEWTPYLYSYALDDSLEPAERALIAAGEIDATGCRYVGERIG